MNQQRILVTGGAGYIGSVLVRILLEKGYRVRVLDNLSFGGDALVEVFTHPNFEFIRGDIRNAETVQTALDGVWGVCHLAAIVGDPACKKFFDDASEINGTASIALFEACERAGVQRFVFASTCSNYGKMKEGGAFVDEDSELNPVSHYAKLKVAYEGYLLQKRSAVCTTILRFSTVYGASPRLRFDLTVNEFTRDVTLGKELVIFGEQFWRPYCHVYDLANSVALVLESPEEKVRAEVFNVGDTAENYTKGMLAEELKKQVPGVQIRYVEQVDDPRDYRVNSDKIRDQLGYRITRTVPDGIREIHAIVSSELIADPYGPKYRNI